MHKNLFLIVFVLLSTNINAATGSVSLSTGFATSTGDYGTIKDTRVIAAPFSVQYQQNRLRLSYSQAWIKIEGPTNTATDSTGDDNLTRSREGLSDPTVSLSYRPEWQLLQQIRHSIATKIKIPTSDAQDNLGTGETDYSVQINTYGRINKSLLALQLGYQWMGDSQTKNYNNRFYSALNLQKIMSNRITLGGRLYFKQRSSSSSTDVLSAGINTSYRLNKHWKASASFAQGFSDSTAEMTINGQISYQLAN